MRSEFLIISKHKEPPRQLGGFNFVYDSNWFSLYSNNSFDEGVGFPLVLIDGYILPRNSNTLKQNVKEQVEIIKDLYNKHGDNFTSFIKGIFTIIIVEESSIKLFTDQLGLSKFFYFIENNTFCISNSYNFVTQHTGLNRINGEALAIKSILNREVGGETLIAGIKYTIPATYINISNNSSNISRYWAPESLLNNGQVAHKIEPFANLLQQNIKSIYSYLKPQNTSLTLTGGKDSRTALTALLGLGIKPLGITYGNPETIDAVYAKELANKAGVDHIIINPPKSIEWFEKSAQDVVNLNNPLINIHRGHRLFAINHLYEKLGDNTSFYTGYMGGELLMGVYFDNLIFTNFIRDFWQNGISELGTIPSRLQNNFIKQGAVDIDNVKRQILDLKTFDSSLEKKLMQFYSMFEIGVLHHSQDIQIAQHYLDFPIPFFLDIDFLELLFQSRFSFLSKNVETKNLLKRHSLFEFNLKLQHIFYPKLDSVFYAKKGTYNTTEFLKGPLYWSTVKAVRYFLNRRKYPPTFSYDESYKLFLINNLKAIISDKNSPINDIYDVPLALESLLQQPLLTTESPLHRYSNIIMHYLQYNKFTKLS